MEFVSWIAGKYASAVSYFNLPVYEGVLKIEGVSQDVEIIRDKWAVPHIYAKTESDLLFAQGFVHAQERLFQMEITRRAAHGQVSELIGKDGLFADKIARIFGFSRLATEDYEKISEEEKRLLDAYLAGINGYLKSSMYTKPVEFKLLNIEPRPWTAHDCCALSRLLSWQMSRGWSAKLVNMAIAEIAEIDPSIAPFLNMPDHERVPSHLSKGIEVNEINWAELQNQAEAPFVPAQDQGSNSWAISGKYTTSGRPILASDPHLGVSNPSIWYEVHLVATDGSLDVTGVSMPGAPYVLIGHNASIAWGITLSYADTTDIWIETIDANDPTKYLFKGEKRDLKIIKEVINVKDGKPHEETIRISHHGPLMNGIVNYCTNEANTRKELSVNGAFISPSDHHVISVFRGIDKAANWNDFKSACIKLETVPLNITYADVTGNIGYFMTGKIPLRSDKALERENLPVDGSSGECEWEQFIPCAENPHTLNPEQGFIVSCNHRIVDNQYPHRRQLGTSFKAGFRAERITNLIKESISRGKVSIYDSAKIQTDGTTTAHIDLIAAFSRVIAAPDFYSQPIAEKALAPDARVHRERVRSFAELLQKFDGNMDKDSVVASVYIVFVDIFLRNVLSKAITTNPRLVDCIMGCGIHEKLIAVNEFHSHDATLAALLLRDTSKDGLINKLGGSRVLVFEALVDTILKLREHFQLSDASANELSAEHECSHYVYGKLHPITFAHAFSAKVPAFTRGPYPCSGSAETPNMNAHFPDGKQFRVKVYPSYRMLVDMGDMVSGAVAIHAPGQSGHLASPHYDDFIEMFMKGEFHPMLWTKQQVLDVEHREGMLLINAVVPPAAAAPATTAKNTSTDASPADAPTAVDASTATSSAQQSSDSAETTAKPVEETPTLAAQTA